MAFFVKIRSIHDFSPTRCNRSLIGMIGHQVGPTRLQLFHAKIQLRQASIGVLCMRMMLFGKAFQPRNKQKNTYLCCSKETHMLDFFRLSTVAFCGLFKWCFLFKCLLVCYDTSTSL